MTRSRLSIALAAAALSCSLMGPLPASASETASSPCPVADAGAGTLDAVLEELAKSPLCGDEQDAQPDKPKPPADKPKGAKDKPSASHCAGAGADPVKTSIRKISRATVCLLNKRRAAHGLRRLRLNPRLSRAARTHSLDMVAERYFAHVSKRGRDVVDRIKRTGYLSSVRSWTVGENLAWGSGTYGTPRQIVEAWMHSAGHRHNILTGRFREIGIGVEVGTPASGARNGATYTTTFGARS